MSQRHATTPWCLVLARAQACAPELVPFVWPQCVAAGGCWACRRVCPPAAALLLSTCETGASIFGLNSWHALSLVVSLSLWKLDLPEGVSAFNSIYGLTMLSGSVILALVHFKASSALVLVCTRCVWGALWCHATGCGAMHRQPWLACCASPGMHPCHPRPALLGPAGSRLPRPPATLLHCSGCKSRCR